VNGDVNVESAKVDHRPFTADGRRESHRLASARSYEKNKVKIPGKAQTKHRKLHPYNAKASHKRQSRAGELAWKKRTPASWKKLLANLESGRQVGETTLADQRRKWQWEGLKIRLAGARWTM
jgi:hypothetical protein